MTTRSTRCERIGHGGRDDLELVGQLRHAPDLDTQLGEIAGQIAAVGVARLAHQQLGTDGQQFGGGDGGDVRVGHGTRV